MQIAHSSNMRQNQKWRSYAVFEPCAHRGKTPSCAELLAELGLSRVVIGARDTNAQAAGGAEILRRGGIEVKFDVCSAAAAELAEPFYLAREGGFCFIKIKSRFLVFFFMTIPSFLTHEYNLSILPLGV